MKWLTRSFTGLLAGLICLDCLNAEDWPGWRGPRGDGVSLEQTAPVTWGPTENLRHGRFLSPAAEDPRLSSAAPMPF